MEVSLDIEIVTMKKGISMNDETHGVRCVSQGGVPGPDPHPPPLCLVCISSAVTRAAALVGTTCPNINCQPLLLPHNNKIKIHYDLKSLQCIMFVTSVIMTLQVSEQ